MGKKLLLVVIYILIHCFSLNSFKAFSQCPTSVSISSDIGNSFCQGSTATFTASPNGGTGPFTYEWKVGNTVQSSTSSTFSSSSLTNGQVVSVTVTDSNGTTCSVTNSGSPITVKDRKTPTVNFQIPAGTKCIGQNISIAASNTEGGSNPNYEWFVDGVSVQSSTSKNLVRSYSEGKTYSIRVVLTSTIDCYTSQTAEVTKNMVIASEPTISSSNPDIAEACLDTPINPIIFNIGGSATGATATGLPPGITGNMSGSTFRISGSPATSGTFAYEVRSTGPCAEAISGGTITVPIDATISLTAGDNAQTVCQGINISSISYAIGGTANNVTVNGLPSGITGNMSGNNFVISGSSNLVGTHNFSVTATGSCADSEPLNGSIIINENLTPTVSISSSEADNEICAGTEVTFEASASNEGSNPTYQWKINNTNSGGPTSSNTFTLSNLSDQDRISVELTSSEECTTANPVTSSEIVTTVFENLTPSVTISADNTTICPGDEVTFSVDDIQNAGTNPNFQWKVNGSNVGSNNSQFTSSTLTNGQTVSLIITSNETCLTASTASSNDVVIEVQAPAPTNLGAISGEAEVCSSALGLTYSVPAVTNATSYNWSFPTGWNITAGEGTNSVTVSAGTGSGNVTVFATNTCGDSNTSSLAVNSINGVPSDPGVISSDLDGNNLICPPFPITFSVTSSGPHQWTVPSGWDIISGTGTNSIQVNVTNAATSGTRSVSVVAQNICGDSPTSTYSGIEINNHIIADFGEDQTICGTQNSITLTGDRSFGNATLQVNFTTSGSGSFSNSTAGGNNKNGPFNITYTPSAADKTAGQVTLTMIVPEPKQNNAGNECGESTDSIILNIIKNATISNPGNSPQEVCINNAIEQINYTITDAGTGATVSGLPAGLSGTFNNGEFTISGTPTEAGTFNYTVTTTGNCDSQQTSQTGIITVNPDHTIQDATNKDQTVCINSAIANMSFEVNSSVDSVEMMGMPAGISGSKVDGNFVISGIPTESGTFNYTLNTVGNCVSTSTSGTLTVNPNVTISEPANKVQTICINAQIENIEFSITNPGSGAIVTGLPEGISGNFNNGVFTISGTATQPGSFEYEVTTEGSCIQVSESGIITVTPDPTAEISYSEEFCTSQGGSFNGTLTGTGDYTGGTFSATPEGLIIDETSGAITPGSSLPKSYTVRYEGPDFCNRAIATTEITINEKPFVDISYAASFCSSNSTLQSPVFDNGVGNYQNGIFSSEPGGLNIDPETGEINPSLSSAGTYKVYYTIGAESSCDEVVIITEVTITQLPQLTISYPELICNSETSIPVTITGEAGAIDGGIYSSDTGLAIDENGEIDPSSSVPGEYTVVYTIASSSGCGEVTASSVFTIKDRPIITTDPVNTGVCSNSPARFEVIATGDDLSYEWYKIVDGTPQLIPGEDESILSFSNVTSADALDYYVLVSGGNTCSSVTSTTFSLNVDEDIVITDPSENITICEDSRDQINFLFKGHANGAPLTFEWVKDGEIVTEIEGKIDLTVAGPEGENGQYTGTLTITDPEPGVDGDSGVFWVVVKGPDYFTCSEATSKTFTFRVDPKPDAPLVTSKDFCLGADSGNLTADGEDGNEIKWYTLDAGIYTYKGNNISVDTANPETFTYYATQTRENGCESDYSEPLVITVLDTPDPIATETIKFEFCFEETVDTALEIIPAEGATINWFNDASEAIDAPIPNTSSQGVETFYVSQTFTATGCESDRTEVTITTKPLPNIDVSITGDQTTICLGNEIILNATGADSYIWYEGESEIGTAAELKITPSSAGEKIYSVVGKKDDCENSFNITITVDEVSVAGILDAPDRLCISNSSATLTLTESIGDIIRWEYKSASTADAWTNIEDDNLSAQRTFSNLTEDTSFRVTVKNGVCTEDSIEATVIIDELPIGGELLWASNSDRLFLTCEDPTTGFGSDLVLSGQTGEVAYWEYRNAPSNTWTRIETQEIRLESNYIESVINNFSTTFRAVLTNESCETGVYSETAITSVIVADIKPTPVQVDKDIICIGDEISLSSETGYSSTGEKFEGGQFTEAGIKNKGWGFTQPDGTVNDYDAGANNGRADHWLKMNASGGPDGKVLTGTLPSGTPLKTIQWTSELNVNEKFALVTGDNDSYMETPVFGLNGLDEAVFTWDQGYNLTAGATITVEISTDGGANYNSVLFTLTSDGTEAIGSSGNYLDFGGGTPQSRPKNKMVVDLGDYLGQSNLRIRFNYDGAKDGDVWAVDNIKVPEGPQDILLQWYYDEDLTDDTNTLEEIGEVNQNTVTFVPRKIGWNDFEVQTRIILDSNGDACQSIDNFETIRVWAFDQYTTEVTANVGACGSLSVDLNATVTATKQAMEITEYPTLDGYVGSWKVFDINDTEVTTGFTFENKDVNSELSAVNNPSAIFTAEELGDYQIRWILTPTAKDENGNLIENSGCPPIDTTDSISLVDCVTLDFDGYDDYVDLGNNYTGSFFLEAWIRPFDRPLPDGGMTDASKGTIFSAPGFELSMENLPASVEPNNRWYHIAVSSNGSTLYIDGIDAGSISVNTSGTNTAAIGARYSASTKIATNHFSGWIEEVRIWKNAPELREIRFMMNQRLKLDASGQVLNPIQGEVVPNKNIDGSYLVDTNNNNLHLEDNGDLLPFYNQNATNLESYFRLYSDNPDPDNKLPGYFLDALKPSNGATPNHADPDNPGRMVNIETDQENTSPTPYFSGTDGKWSEASTWARPNVWESPNSGAIEWNIARISHNIYSDDKDIIMLGLLSLENVLDINPSKPLRITHYLLLNGGIDLEGESQLIQDHGSILDNNSAGWLEVNQKGRMSSFNYNYWTSPVTDQGKSNNSGFTLGNVLYDGDKEDNPNKVNFKPGYYVADQAKTSPITISTEWIWDFRGNSADEYNDWQFMGSDFRQIVGAGYSMKGTDGNVDPNIQSQKYTFRGKPNNGNIPTGNLLEGAELKLGNEQNYLVGNPYPSSIDALEFMKDNLSNGRNVFNGALYYWDHFSGSSHILAEYIGGYAVFNYSGSIESASSVDSRINNNQQTSNNPKPKQYIPVGQGFFLNSTSIGSTNFGGEIIFKNTQRYYEPISSGNSVFKQRSDKLDNNQVEKSNHIDERAKIRLKFESPAGYHRQILVTRDANTTNGFDVGYDAPLIENNKEDMYWWFDDGRFVIQGVPDFEKLQTLPLAIKTASEGSFTIKIDSTENWPTNKDLYLKDKQNDSIHDLLADSYQGTTATGEISDRFEVVFFKEIAQEPDPVVVPEEPNLPVIDNLVGISYSTFSRNVKISNEDLLKVEKVLIYDMGGKLIQEFEGMPTEKEIFLGLRPVRSGVYIVKVFCENAICNKKIIVK